MNDDEIEIIFLIDRSGSMNVCEEDTIGGYNSFIERQRQGSPGAFVTTVLFDNHYEVFCDHEEISRAKSLTSEEYYARGSTALLDALGLTISRAASRQAEEGRQSRTLMVIITDGLDNSSRVYSIKTIFDMIRERERHGWEFIFLGADMDAVRTAQSIGISRDRAGNFTKDSMSIRGRFDGISRTVARFRDTGGVSTDWRK